MGGLRWLILRTKLDRGGKVYIHNGGLKNETF
jgi:hypothetical protein